MGCKDKSAAICCHQLAAWVPDMFFNFFWLKITRMLTAQQPLKLVKK
jgi:hypothetical protein